MRVALDSNVIIYAEGLSDDPRNKIAQDLIASIPAASLVIPLQAIAETLQWLVKRAKIPRHEAVESAGRWIGHYAVQATDHAVIASGLDLMSVHNLQTFDAIILAAAAEAHADFLLSEDMQNGFRWRGVTVANPFLQVPLPQIARLLKPKEHHP